MISWLALGVVVWLASKGASGGDDRYGCISLISFFFLLMLGFLIGSVLGDKHAGVWYALLIVTAVWFVGLVVLSIGGATWKA
jgi:hypothetical protein